MHGKVMSRDFEASYARSCVPRMLSCAACVDCKGLVSIDDLLRCDIQPMEQRLVVRKAAAAVCLNDGKLATGNGDKQLDPCNIVVKAMQAAEACT